MPADVIQGSFPPEAVRRLAAARGAAPRTPKARSGGAVQASPRSGVPAWPLPAAVSIGRGAGQRLPGPVQRKMERLLGASFADVQVHVGPEAAALGAYAFTRGPHLYFAPGRYAPDTPAGQRLLAHELTHVLQQRAGRVRNPFGRGVAVVHDPALEAEAERNGLRALAQPVSRPSAPPGAAGTVQRAVARPGSAPGSRTPGRGAAMRPLPGRAKRFRAASARVVQRAPLRPRRSDRSTERDERSPYSLRQREDKNRRSGRRRSVKPTAPTVAGWRKIMWDGRSRLPWDNPGQHMGQECESCAEGGDGVDAEAMDHIVPFRVYIFNHADPEVFCDGENHWEGIPYREARELYNDPKNLRPLCKPCNSTKAPEDRDNPHNTENAPVYKGPCPGEARCDAVPLYGRR